MSSLSNTQKRLVFDYCLGLTREDEATLARGLICSTKDAAKIHKGLQAILGLLEAVRPCPCPNYLLLRTLRLAKSQKEEATKR